MKKFLRISTPILIPYEPEEFWKILRKVIREEMLASDKGVEHSVEGLDYKPLYKMSEVCKLFKVTRPTIYDWIKHGKLKPFKVRSRVYFLWKDLEGMFGDKEPSLVGTNDSNNNKTSERPCLTRFK